MSTTQAAGGFRAHDQLRPAPIRTFDSRGKERLAPRPATGSTLSADGSSIGFNAGVDVAYFFTPRVGIGGMLQFSRASVEIESAAVSQDVKAGGTKAGGGLRLRF